MITMVFSKQKYKQFKHGTNLPESHLNAIDGKEVIFKHISGDKFGIVEEYKADGQEWYLYPVMPEWCEERAQMQLSDFIATS
jgi:hypothetical protein